MDDCLLMRAMRAPASCVKEDAPMEREGERPRIQGKSLNATSRRERSGERVLFAGKLLSALLAVVLAAGLLPIVPASPVVEEDRKSVV